MQRSHWSASPARALTVRAALLPRVLIVVLAAPASLAALAALGGCDGGISGTGVPPVEATGPGEPGDGVGENGQAAPTGNGPASPVASPTSGEDANANADADADGATARALVNARAVRDGAPVVRVVNVSGESLSVSTGDGAGEGAGEGADDGADDGATVPVAPLAASGTAGGTIIAVELSAPQAPLRLVSAVRTTPLATFDPLALVDGSVTTLLFGPGAAMRTALIALETEVAPSDPTLARVRIVTTLAEGAAGTIDELVLRSEGTDRQLGASDAARSASDYLAVPPGEYRVRDADGTVFDGALLLEAGDVVTGVLIAPEGDGAPRGGAVPRLLTLVDGAAAR